MSLEGVSVNNKGVSLIHYNQDCINIWFLSYGGAETKQKKKIKTNKKKSKKANPSTIPVRLCVELN